MTNQQENKTEGIPLSEAESKEVSAKIWEDIKRRNSGEPLPMFSEMLVKETSEAYNHAIDDAIAEATKCYIPENDYYANMLIDKIIYQLQQLKKQTP